MGIGYLFKKKTFIPIWSGYGVGSRLMIFGWYEAGI
jgi:hypothetical protein